MFLKPTRSWWVDYVEPILGIVTALLIAGTLVAAHTNAATKRNDFSDFVESARSLREGGDPYQRPVEAGPDTNLNTPAAMLVFVPFSLMPTVVAFDVWTLIAIAAYIGAAYRIASAIAPSRTISIAGAILVTQAAIASLLLGQTTGLLTLLLTVAWIADRHDRRWSAGFLVGVAIGFKPFLALFGVYAVWRRSQPWFFGMCAGALAVALIGLLAVGVDGYRSWLATLADITWTAHVLNGSLLGLLARTLSTTPEVLHATPLVNRYELVVPLWWGSALVVALAGGRALYLTRDRDKAWSIVAIGSLLLSPLGWVYYLPIAAGPIMAVALKSRRAAQVLLAVGYACLLVPPLAASTSGASTAMAGSIANWALLLLFAGAAQAVPSVPTATQRRW